MKHIHQELIIISWKSPPHVIKKSLIQVYLIYQNFTINILWRKWLKTLPMGIIKIGGMMMKKDNDKISNGYMTNNMEDVIFLGKQMENMRDGKQLDEDERSPDPKQFDEDEYTNN
mgnify:CR=1 FL=1